MRLHPGAAILFSDTNWIVVNKPTGISTHGAFAGDIGMQEWLKLHLNMDTFVCSRLDKGTSGVLVFARTAQASKLAQIIHERELAKKEYYFLSHADSVNTLGTGKWTETAPIGGKSATTAFERVGGEKGKILYRAIIQRGRTHQIRIHAAANGIPILGDSEYAGVQFPRLALHCASVQWPEIELPWHSELPQSFKYTKSSTLQFPEELWSSFDRRLGWLSTITNAFRVVHRGEWHGLDCAIDLYHKHFCVWVYNEKLTLEMIVRSLNPALEMLTNHYGAEGWVIKRSLRNPHNSGLVNEQEIVHKPPPDLFYVAEHKLNFQVTLTKRQHVGIFLDQRDNRRRISLAAANERVANLFAFTCSFSIAAAAGGAEIVFSVDAANSVLNIGKQNFLINNLTEEGRGKFVCEDVRKWLNRQSRRVVELGDCAKFGVIVCDPPVFSSTKESGTFHVQENWRFLAENCSNLLTQNGQVIFSTNHRAGEQKFYLNILKEFFPVVEELSVPIDFPELDSKTTHVKLFKAKLT